MKICVHWRTCMWMHKAVWFIIVKTGNNPNVHLTVMYPNSDTLLSNKKKGIIDTCNHTDDSQKHYGQWMKPDSKGYNLNDSITWHSGEDKTIGTEHRSAVLDSWSLRRGRRRGLTLKGQGTFLGDRHVHLDCGFFCYMNVHICQTHWTICLKRVNLIV